MDTKIFIDIEGSDNNLNIIGNSIYQQLKNNNYNVTLLDNNQNINNKINIINSETGEVIVVSNRVNINNLEGTEIIYSLRDTDQLATLIENNLSNYSNVLKFYQLRLPSDTSMDYYQIIRDTPNAETIIISYNPNDLINKTNQTNLINSVVNGIINYIKRANIYVVQSGDSLYSIANKLDVSLQELIQVNDLANTNLSIGQELIIPSKAPSLPPDNNIDSNIEGIIYTVQSGDSLYSIARRFNTTVDAIKSLNNLTSNNLSIGQVLRIPGTSFNAGSNNNNITNYTVQSGDSLYSIARRFNTTVDAIKTLNNLTSNNLSIGQVLRIPGTSFNTGSNNNNITNYTVQSGDSLYSIARRFNTTVDAIKSLNNLTSNNLSIGQVLRIPGTSSDTGSNNNNNITNYTVQSGDSLYSIARRFNTTVDAIKSLNNLTSNNLSIGQVLKIST